MNSHQSIVSLNNERRAVLDTNEAAFHLGRRPQTLRKWACLENGPIRPIRIHGRLGWRVEDLKRIVGMEVGE